MTDKKILELNKVYCMDCLDGIKQIKDNSIDLIVTDPPYYEIMVIDHKGESFDWDNQWATFQDYLNWFELIVVEMKRVLKPTGSLFVFADDKICAYIQVMMDKYFNLENNIIWFKPNNMTIKGWRNYRCFAPVTERLLFYSLENPKKRPTVNDARRLFKPRKNYTDVWKFNIIGGSENVDHPTQKPIKIIERIIKTVTNENDIVLDLFMGSGTTAVASKELNRQFIGFEKSLQYYDIINQRLMKVNNKKLHEWFDSDA